MARLERDHGRLVHAGIGPKYWTAVLLAQGDREVASWRGGYDCSLRPPLSESQFFFSFFEVWPVRFEQCLVGVAVDRSRRRRRWRPSQVGLIHARAALIPALFSIDVAPRPITAAGGGRLSFALHCAMRCRTKRREHDDCDEDVTDHDALHLYSGTCSDRNEGDPTRAMINQANVWSYAPARQRPSPAPAHAASPSVVDRANYAVRFIQSLQQSSTPGQSARLQ
jgi:hypothetical protein